MALQVGAMFLIMSYYQQWNKNAIGDVYNVLHVTLQRWRKIQWDKVEPTTWEAFKAMFYNNFVSINECP